MSIKLKGSSDGSVSLDAPADTSPSGSDITLTLPTSAGSANQFLKNSGIAGELEYSSMVEDSSDRLLLGTTSSRNVGANTEGRFQLEQAASKVAFSIVNNVNSATGGIISLAKARGTTAGSTTIVQNSDQVGEIRFAAADGTDVESNAARIGCFIDGTPGANDTPGRLVFSTSADGSQSPTERMRISSDGKINFGTTVTTNVGNNESTSTVAGGMWCFNSKNGNSVLRVNQTFDDSATRNAIQFYRNESPVGHITVSTSATAYNTTSDYRLKENVVDLDGAITRVKQLQPKRFNFIVDADTTVDGFLAHEAQTVVPEAVTGTHNEVDNDGNAVMQGIDQSKLVPLLTAALQEAIAKIETLETKVAALEAA